MAKKEDDDRVVEPQVIYTVRNPDNKHYLKVDAYYGATQATSFLNAEGKVVVITNQNNDGFLGYGRDLTGKTITIRTRANADIDDLGIDRVRLDYFIDDQVDEIGINQYDKPEDEDPSPYIKFDINFK
jgi:hypothetical protein